MRHIRPPELNGGREAEKQARQRGQQEIESQKAKVYLRREWQLAIRSLPNHAREQSRCLRRQDNAEHSSDSTQQQPFGKQLAQHSASLCAQRVTNRHFSYPSRSEERRV